MTSLYAPAPHSPPYIATSLVPNIVSNLSFSRHKSWPLPKRPKNTIAVPNLFCTYRRSLRTPLINLEETYRLRFNLLTSFLSFRQRIPFSRHPHHVHSFFVLEPARHPRPTHPTTSHRRLHVKNLVPFSRPALSSTPFVSGKTPPSHEIHAAQSLQIFHHLTYRFRSHRLLHRLRYFKPLFYL